MRALSLAHSLQKYGNEMSNEGKFHRSKLKLDPIQNMKASVKDSLYKSKQLLCLTFSMKHPLNYPPGAGGLINRALERIHNSETRPTGQRALT